MTTKEFIEKIESLRLSIIDDTSGNFIILNHEGCGVARVSYQSAGFIDFSLPQFNMLPTIVKTDLILIMGWYASTPIEDRDVKKYRLKFHIKHISVPVDRYLVYNPNDDEYYFENYEDNFYSNCQTVFTEEEIERIKEIIDIDACCKMTEVEDDN